MNRFGTRAAMLALVVAMCTAGPSTADVVAINNGLAPPNPENVIDAGNSYPDDKVYVQNVGCNVPPYPCPLPWGDPTSVEVVEGGAVGSLLAYASSSVTVSGGEVERIDAFDSASVTLSGGEVGFVVAIGSSTLAIDGGSATEVLMGFDFCTVTMTRGSMNLLGVFGSCAVTISGGSLWRASAGDSSTVTIAGTNFAVNGAPVSYGPILAPSGTLTGTLESGEPLDTEFCHNGCQVSDEMVLALTGLITLVPEPDAAPLALTSVACLAALRRRRSPEVRT